MEALRTCRVDRCLRPVGRNGGRGYCQMHYARVLRRGGPGGAEPELGPPTKGTTCGVESCERLQYARGYCQMHYWRWRRTGALGGPESQRQTAGPCNVEGCDRMTQPGGGRGYCSMHYQRLCDHGHPGEPEPRRGPDGRGHIRRKDGYRVMRAYGHPNADPQGSILEHRLVMSRALGRALLPGETVHHRNGDRTDNRLENLELWAGHHSNGQRTPDLVASAVQVLRQYAPERLAATP